MALRQFTNIKQFLCPIWRHQVQLFSTGAVKRSSNQDMIDLPDDSLITHPIPPYEDKIDEPLQQRKARLLYQSRKRGMLENGLLLSSFAAKYLDGMTVEQTQQYDRLINLPTNDWDIYYWAIGRLETPLDFDNGIMTLLKDHVQNKKGESRIRQPDLYTAEPAKDLYSKNVRN